MCLDEVSDVEWIILVSADIPQCLWDGVTQNEEDLSYMLEETTPIKACGDLAYHVTDHGLAFFFPFFPRFIGTSMYANFTIEKVDSRKHVQGNRGV